MSKNEEVDPQFLEFQNASLGYDRNYIPANCRGVLEVVEITKKDGYQGVSLIFTYKTVECEAIPGTVGKPSKVGEVVASVTKIDEKGKTGDAKRNSAFTQLCRIVGLTQAPNPKDIPALLTKATSADQPYRGYRVAYRTPKGDNGKAFPMFSSLPNPPEEVAARRDE